MREILVLLLLVLAACAPVTPGSDDELLVVATVFPIWDITREIVGSAGRVEQLIPAGSNLHSYKPTARQLIDLSPADVFITLGLEFEPVENRLMNVAEQAIVVDVKGGIALLDTDAHVHKSEEAAANAQAHADSTFDAHLWSSPKNMITIADTIANSLATSHPADAITFRSNAARVKAQLEQLDHEYRTALSRCDKDVFVVNHAAFGYMAQEYGLEQVGIFGLSVKREPTAGEFRKIHETIEEHGLKYIFFENLASPRVAEAIAEDTGVQLLPLNPLGGTKDPDATYFSLMRENLENLKIALECD